MNGRTGSGQRLQVRVALDLVERGRWDLGRDIDAARLELGHQGGRVGDRSENQRLDLRRPLPVVWVGLQHDPLVLLPLLEGEGAGPDWLLEEGVALRLDLVHRDDRMVVQEDERQGVRLGRLDDHRHIVRRLG